MVLILVYFMVLIFKVPILVCFMVLIFMGLTLVYFMVLIVKVVQFLFINIMETPLVEIIVVAHVIEINVVVQMRLDIIITIAKNKSPSVPWTCSRARAAWLRP